MPDNVHQISRVLAVVDCKGRIEPNVVGILTQEPSAHGMERSRPGQCTAYHSGAVAHDESCDAFDASRHLSRGTARKGHQQYPAGVGTVDDQMGDPVSQGVGLSGTRARDNEQRHARWSALLPHAMLDSSSLFAVEAFKISNGHRR